MARPSLFNEALAGEICDRIACGESLAAICRGEDPERETDMPAYRTVMTWLRENAEFRLNYASARAEQGHANADSVTDIGDRVLKGDFDPQAARVAIDALKWSAGKRQPKVYGDAQTLRHTGPSGGPIEYANLTEADVDARLAGILGADQPTAPAPEA